MMRKDEAVDVSEKNFEVMIESALLGREPAALPGGASPGRETSPGYGLMKPGGYRKRTPEIQDRWGASLLLPQPLHHRLLRGPAGGEVAG